MIVTPLLRSLFIAALVSAAGLAAISAEAIAAPCRTKGDRPQVFVKGKTPIRRGPGLNFPVSSFLEEGKCMALGEVSVDERFVLVQDEATKTFGWVAVGSLDAASRDLLPGANVKGPIGSGQERGYVSTKLASSLLGRPDAAAEVRRVVPPGSRLLALSITEDGRWVEVRDDRGETGWVSARGLKDESDTLTGLPRADTGLKTGFDKSGAKSGSGGTSRRDLVEDPVRGERSRSAKDRAIRPQAMADQDDATIATSIPTAQGVAIEGQVRAVAALPRHGFDSNGQLGVRRYAVRAFAAGAALEGIAAPLGSFRARASYSFVLLTGLTPPGGGATALSGQEHDFRVLFGYPIRLGSLRLIPEAGYAFALFAMEPTLQGSPAQFYSSHTHGLSLGATLVLPLSDSFALEGEVAALVGTTIEYPFDVGSPGITLGANTGLGARIALGGGASLVGRWDFRTRTSPFEGKSTTDPTITRATISHVEHGFSAGLAFAF